MGRIEISKKIGDSKGTFHAKMGTIKDRNGKDLTEAEDIKRWQEYTEGSLIFPSLEEFSTVCCDPHSQRLWCSQ